MSVVAKLEIVVVFHAKDRDELEDLVERIGEQLELYFADKEEEAVTSFDVCVLEKMEEKEI